MITDVNSLRRSIACMKALYPSMPLSSLLYLSDIIIAAEGHLRFLTGDEKGCCPACYSKRAELEEHERDAHGYRVIMEGKMTIDWRDVVLVESSGAQVTVEKMMYSGRETFRLVSWGGTDRRLHAVVDGKGIQRWRDYEREDADLARPFVHNAPPPAKYVVVYKAPGQPWLVDPEAPLVVAAQNAETYKVAGFQAHCICVSGK